MRGEVELEDGVLIIKRIHVRYNITAPESARSTIDRVNGFHAQKCPIYRSLYKCIPMTTDYVIHDPGCS